LSAAAAGLVGLPFLYRDEPLLAEYCAGYGEAVADADALGPCLRAMMKNYLMWSERAAAYPHSARATTRAYLALVDRLVANAEAITAARRSWRRRLARLVPGFGG